MHRFRWLLLAALCNAGTILAQAPASSLPAGYTYVEQMPVFPGGQEAMLRTLGETIFYPTEALQQKLEGRVFVQFVVDTTGNVRSAAISKSIHPLLDAAAVQAVAKLPAFTPGRQLGKPVPVSFTVPITFKLPPNVPEILAARAAAVSQAVAPASQSESKARFPGGPEALRTYLSNQPLLPGYEVTAARTPRVFVEFEVDAAGVVRNAKAAQLVDPTERRRMHQRPTIPPPNPLLLAAAVARVSEMPAWEPATEKGQRITSTRTEVVTFGEASPALSYADEMPIFPVPKGEGYHMATQIRYPAAALRTQTQGAVLLYYEVAEDGRVEKLEVIRSVSPEIDAEALRVFSNNFPRYQPARHQGQPVRVYYVMPVTFKVL